MVCYEPLGHVTRRQHKGFKCATTVLSSETEVSITFSLINVHPKSDGGHSKIEAFKAKVRSQLAKQMKVCLLNNTYVFDYNY